MGILTDVLSANREEQTKIAKSISLHYNNCPVKFTKDIEEFCESKDFMGVTFRSKIQKKAVLDFYEGFPNERKYSTGVMIGGMR